MENTTDNRNTEIIKENNGSMRELERAIASCQECPLCESRTNPVPGSGSYTAKVMIIGEAPGFNEDKKGIPFCGRSGDLLDKLLGDIGLSRDTVFIANTVKCRPPENRNPQADELEKCLPFLRAQIEIVKPQVIITLGTFASQFTVGSDAPISRLRGQLFYLEDHDVFVVPTFHPAYVLRNRSKYLTVLADLKRVKEVLDGRYRSVERAEEAQ